MLEMASLNLCNIGIRRESSLKLVYGAKKFRTANINQQGKRIIIGRFYDLLITWAVPAQVLILIGWWFSTIISSDPDGW